jgi:uncharacterized protein YlxP (DUF503 family)
MVVGVVTLHFRLPGCASLKEKRGRIKPILARLHREFGLAAAEVDLQDRWGEAVLAAAALANQHAQVEQVLQRAVADCEQRYADADLYDAKIELIAGV